jgi:hypothetical protein
MADQVACVMAKKPSRLLTRYTNLRRQILLHEMLNRIPATLDDSQDHKLGRRPLYCAVHTGLFGTSQQPRDTQSGFSATADDMGTTVNRLKRSPSPWRLYSSGQNSEHHALQPWLFQNNNIVACSNSCALTLRQRPLVVGLNTRLQFPEDPLRLADGFLPLQKLTHRSPISLRRTYSTQRATRLASSRTLLCVSAHSHPTSVHSKERTRVHLPD